MVKSEKKFVKVSDPVSDLIEARKEILKLRFAKVLGGSSYEQKKCKILRRFVARCLTMQTASLTKGQK